MAKLLLSLTGGLFRFFLFSKRGRFLTGAAVLLLLLIGFAPTTVALTPLRHAVAAHILRGLPGTVHVGSASLGWFAPVVLRLEARQG